VTVQNTAVARRRGRPNAADATEKRREILRVATELFLARGYREVTTRMVAEAAGVARQTLFNLYTEKAQLFQACLDYASPTYPGSAINPADEPAAALPRFAVDLVQWLSRENSLGFSRLIMVDGRNSPELSSLAEKHQNAHFIGPLAEYLTKWALEHPGDDANARVFIAMAIAQWSQAISFGHDLPDRPQTESHAQRITGIFLKGAARQLAC